MQSLEPVLPGLFGLKLRGSEEYRNIGQVTDKRLLIMFLTVLKLWCFRRGYSEVCDAYHGSERVNALSLEEPPPGIRASLVVCKFLSVEAQLQEVLSIWFAEKVDSFFADGS